MVQNMAGAGGIIGANYVYEIAKPDGLTIGVFSGMYLPQILGGAGVRYDLNKMPIIAGAAETSIVYIRADTEVKTPADLLKPAKPIVLGGFTSENNKDLALRLAFDLLGVPYKYVTGYAGVAELRVAIQRGEINVTSESLTGYNTGGSFMVSEGTSCRSIRKACSDPTAIRSPTPAPTSRRSRNFFEESKAAIPAGRWPKLTKSPAARAPCCASSPCRRKPPASY